MEKYFLYLTFLISLNSVGLPWGKSDWIIYELAKDIEDPQAKMYFINKCSNVKSVVDEVQKIASDTAISCGQLHSDNVNFCDCVNLDSASKGDLALMHRMNGMIDSFSFYTNEENKQIIDKNMMVLVDSIFQEKSYGFPMLEKPAKSCEQEFNEFLSRASKVNSAHAPLISLLKENTEKVASERKEQIAKETQSFVDSMKSDSRRLERLVQSKNRELQASHGACLQAISHLDKVLEKSDENKSNIIYSLMANNADRAEKFRTLSSLEQFKSFLSGIKPYQNDENSVQVDYIMDLSYCSVSREFSIANSLFDTLADSKRVKFRDLQTRWSNLREQRAQLLLEETELSERQSFVDNEITNLKSELEALTLMSTELPDDIELMVQLEDVKEKLKVFEAEKLDLSMRVEATRESVKLRDGQEKMIIEEIVALFDNPSEGRAAVEAMLRGSHRFKGNSINLDNGIFENQTEIAKFNSGAGAVYKQSSVVTVRSDGRAGSASSNVNTELASRDYQSNIPAQSYAGFRPAEHGLQTRLSPIPPVASVRNESQSIKDELQSLESKMIETLSSPTSDKDDLSELKRLSEIQMRRSQEQLAALERRIELLTDENRELANRSNTTNTVEPRTGETLQSSPRQVVTNSQSVNRPATVQVSSSSSNGEVVQRSEVGAVEVASKPTNPIQNTTASTTPVNRGSTSQETSNSTKELVFTELDGKEVSGLESQEIVPLKQDFLSLSPAEQQSELSRIVGNKKFVFIKFPNGKVVKVQGRSETIREVNELRTLQDGILAKRRAVRKLHMDLKQLLENYSTI